MNFDLFKIDTWWKAVFILGLIACAGACFFNLEFIQQKHLFGLGMGMILIGISFWMAWKTLSVPMHGGILSSKLIKHNVVSIILLIIGIMLIGLFGFFVVKGLI